MKNDLILKEGKEKGVIKYVSAIATTLYIVIHTVVVVFSVCSTPMLLQSHVEDPSYSAKSAGGRLHLNPHMPLTQ